MQVIDLEIPVRTPTLNDWQRMHWSRRQRLARAIAAEVWVAMTRAGIRRPDQPLKRCRIEIDRESTQEPDEDGLKGGMKPLLDALQWPSRRHPYGVGLIADDSPRCVIGLEANHVPGKGSRTRIRIFPVDTSGDAGAATATR